MDQGKKEVDYAEVPVPGKVDVVSLKLFFKEKYELEDTQAEALVLSSCESLKELLAIARELLEKGDKKMPYDDIRAVVHRAKGLFLIMGQDEWALYTTTLKKSGVNKVYDNLVIVVNRIEQNFSEIIVLCG